MPNNPAARDLLLYQYGPPVRLPASGTAAALRAIGRRPVTHPRDVLALAVTSPAAAIAWMCLYRDRWGYPILGIAGGVGGSAAGVLDLRLWMAHAGIPVTDPDLPDDPDWEGPR